MASQGPIDVLEVSPCGECVLIEQRTVPVRTALVCESAVRQSTSAPCSRSARQLVTARWLRPIRSHLHRHFRAVGCSSSGQLVLVSTKQSALDDRIARFEMPWRRVACTPASSAVKVKSFDQRVNLPDGAFRLDRATFEMAAGCTLIREACCTCAAVIQRFQK